MLEKFSQMEVAIGPLSFQLYSFKDPYSEFSNHLDQGDGSAEPPLYGLLWPAAEALARTLWQEHGETLAGKKVLEIGCGLALPSLVCARLGADVTAMDYHPHFAAILQHNLDANHLSCTALRGNFTDPDLQLGSFDWIVASDILYERDQYASLDRFIADHSKPGTKVLIADPGRYAAGEFGTILKGSTIHGRSSQTLPSGQSIDIFAFNFPEASAES